MKTKPVWVIVLCLCLHVQAQQTRPLYEGDIPNTKGDAPTIPELTVYLPDEALAIGTAVIVCPGGGYGGLVMDREGHQVAKDLNSLGVAAFVLKYRLPDGKTCVDKSIAPLQDAQQAIKVVREQAATWRINARRIGLIGFSAGGHLVTSAGTLFAEALIPNPQGTSLRPDFVIGVYPVVSMQSDITHAGSRQRLLGDAPSSAQVDRFSPERQVTPQTPPVFLIHGTDDSVVPVENSLRFYVALKAQGVGAGLHIYAKGEHGFPDAPAKTTWFKYCAEWLKENRWLDRAQPKNGQ
ncbi:MAG: alpha/beta hydrolase [Phycisphaeraceae bacterium]|nr:alpha/beta hydrolase [Phycisphaeraceae bacterium]